MCSVSPIFGAGPTRGPFTLHCTLQTHYLYSWNSVIKKHKSLNESHMNWQFINGSGYAVPISSWLVTVLINAPSTVYVSVVGYLWIMNSKITDALAVLVSQSATRGLPRETEETHGNRRPKGGDTNAGSHRICAWFNKHLVAGNTSPRLAYGRYVPGHNRKNEMC
jgi:hypothetical protein